MPPPDPKAPGDPASPPGSPHDDGPRWLARPADPATTAAGATLPTTKSNSVAPGALKAELGVGRWGFYARIAGIVLLVVAAVVAALLLVARTPNETSATKALGALATSSGKPAAAPSTSTNGASNGAAASVALPQSIPPIPSAVPSAAESASAAPSAAPPAVTDEGTISTPPSAGGHRVFVDGRYAGDSPGPIKVRCGSHVVKVGSGGTPHTVDVACGSDVVVPAR